MEHASAIRNWQIILCVSRPASASRFGGRYLVKLVRGSNLALVSETVQSRPMTTFPESWHDYPEQYFGSFAQWICLPGFPKWRYGQNYSINKWQVLIRKAFLGRIPASPGSSARLDDIIGKTCQTYNSLLYHFTNWAKMVTLWVNFQIWSPPSWNTVFGPTWLRNSSRPRILSQVWNPVGPQPVYGTVVCENGWGNGLQDLQQLLEDQTDMQPTRYTAPMWPLPLK